MKMQLVVRRGSIKKAFTHKKIPEFEALTTMCEKVVFLDGTCSLVVRYECFERGP